MVEMTVIGYHREQTGEERVIPPLVCGEWKCELSGVKSFQAGPSLSRLRVSVSRVSGAGPGSTVRTLDTGRHKQSHNPSSVNTQGDGRMVQFICVLLS